MGENPSPCRIKNKLSGLVFGHLTVVGPHEKVGKHWKWHCECVCGKAVSVFGTNLREGKTKSCGCMQGFVKHGHARHGIGKKPSRTYSSYMHMLTRCYSPTAFEYQWYGAKGVIVCDRWRQSFENFLADMGERPAGKSIDRIDPHGSYEPSNCRWATHAEQMKNLRKHKPVVVV